MLLNDVLIPKLLSNPFASLPFTNLDFLFQRSVHFDCIINPPFFVLKVFKFKFLVFFYTLHNKSPFSFIALVSKKTEDKLLIHILDHIRFSILSLKFLSVKQIARFDFPLILFVEIRTTLFVLKTLIYYALHLKHFVFSNFVY